MRATASSGAAEIGGDNANRLQRLGVGAEPPHLRDPTLGQERVVLSLEALFGVPLGFAVAHEDEPHCWILSPVAAKTASGVRMKERGIGSPGVAVK